MQLFSIQLLGLVLKFLCLGFVKLVNIIPAVTFSYCLVSEWWYWKMTLHLVLSLWRVLPKIIYMYSLNLFHKNSKTIHCHWRALPPKFRDLTISIHCEENRLWEFLNWSPWKKCFDLSYILLTNYEEIFWRSPACYETTVYCMWPATPAPLA